MIQLPGGGGRTARVGVLRIDRRAVSPVLSPDGRRLVYLSERDMLSVGSAPPRAR